ncbi:MULTISPECIES: glycoside hydrolase family 10 protein [Cyanophyceae]|uniref:glycoside hydrolase family 10 protein n=1 Tax=Cyanophyceae TaxID=3028117 RepID=UPI0018EF915E|nr:MULTISPECIES: glycoside hydrolase family 10 protein [Cyanophyceae]
MPSQLKHKLKHWILLFWTALLAVVMLGGPTIAFPPPVVPWEVNPSEIAPIPQSFQKIRGVWLTTNDINILRESSRVQSAMATLSQLNFNTVYPVVWNSGYALYPSVIAQRAGIPYIHRGAAGQDILADVINQAHRQGLLAIPWFEFGFMAPPLSELTLAHPDWLTQRQDGSQTSISAAGEVVWLNPFKPEVQQFINSLVAEIAVRYDIDGIQFDDHTALPSDFGYDSYTRLLYQQETKQPVPSNPRDPAWMRWRADKITDFVAQLNQTVKQYRPQAIFSVSPNPYDTAYNSFLQDWVGWINRGLVDELLVQIYRWDINSFTDQMLRPEIQMAQTQIPVGIGILTGLRNRPMPMSMIQAQVMRATAQGLGVAFFYYESLWYDAPEPVEERQARFRDLFSVPASRFSLRRQV